MNLLLLYMFIIGIILTVNNSKRDGAIGLLVNFIVMPFVVPFVWPFFLAIKTYVAISDAKYAKQGEKDSSA